MLLCLIEVKAKEMFKYGREIILIKKIYALIMILCLSINIVGCSKSINIVGRSEPVAQDFNEINKSSQKSKVNENEDFQAAEDYLKKINYKVAVNSAAGQKILLPDSFESKYNNFDIGSFLKEKNEKSKKNGLDFKDYLGKEVLLYTYASEKQEGDLVLLISNGKVIGAWKDDKVTDPEKGELGDFHVILQNTKNIRN